MRLWIALSLVACGGGTGGGGIEVVSEMFATRCSGSGCHIDHGGAAGGLDLAPAAMCAELIGVPATEQPAELLVDPGAADRSYLLCKIDPDRGRLPATATLMPLGGEGLTGDQIAIVRDWIDGGAEGCAAAGAPVFDGVESATGLPSAIRLEWSPATDDVTPSAEIEYLIFASDQSGGQDFSAPVKVTEPGATSAVIGGLPVSAERFFVVRARDGAGSVDANTVERSATTAATADQTPPVFAGAVSAAAIGSRTVEVSWAPATDNVTPAEDLRYAIYVADSSGAQAFDTPLAVVTGDTTGLVSDLASETTYFVVVRASDGINNEDTNTAEVSATTGAPIGFSGEIVPILVAECATAGCHRNPMPSAALDLSAGVAYSELVGVDSTQCSPARALVAAGAPDDSYLIDKLLGRDLCFGTRMPKSMNLPAGDIQLISDWIAEGALDN